MSWCRQFVERLTGRADRHPERELRARLELEAEEQQDAGLATKDARYAAQRAFGNVTSVKEDVREAWGWIILETLAQDLRFAMRQFRYSVVQRTREIGIRMALGAERSNVLKLMLAQGLKLALVGISIGLAAALALSRVMASFLYGIKPTDPITFATVPIVLCAVGLAAICVPARRAMTVDPAVTLRYE